MVWVLGSVVMVQDQGVMVQDQGVAPAGRKLGGSGGILAGHGVARAPAPTTPIRDKSREPRGHGGCYPPQLRKSRVPFPLRPADRRAECSKSCSRTVMRYSRTVMRRRGWRVRGGR
eukprot:Hpha_TRINITY_DN14820_c0_g1::TRINITY_DN14820_c0_g1_i1::g.169352::m.169352